MNELLVSVSTQDGKSGLSTVVCLGGEADGTTQELEDVLGAETAKKPRRLLVDAFKLALNDCAAPSSDTGLTERLSTVLSAAPVVITRNDAARHGALDG